MFSGEKRVRVKVTDKFGAKTGGDINVLPFGCVGEINFKKQLDGSADELVKLGRLSLNLKGALLLGCVSDNYGVKRRSAFLFEKGRLRSICDMNAYEEGYACSFGYKIFSVGSKKAGVLVDKDLYSPAAVEALVSCGCDAIINLYEGFSGRKAELAAEFYSYVYGVNFVFVSENVFFAFDSDGNPLALTTDKIVDLPDLKKCKEVRVKKRGLRI